MMTMMMLVVAIVMIIVQTMNFERRGVEHGGKRWMTIPVCKTPAFLFFETLSLFFDFLFECMFDLYRTKTLERKASNGKQLLIGKREAKLSRVGSVRLIRLCSYPPDEPIGLMQVDRIDSSADRVWTERERANDCKRTIGGWRWWCKKKKRIERRGW